MSVELQPVQSSRRRYLRLSIRGLIVLIVCIGGGLGYLVHQARVQRDAVAAIRRAGGTVYYNWTWNHDRFITPRKTWAPRRLIDLLGIDYFGHVTAVRLGKPDNASLAEVGCLPGLQQLSFGRWPDNTADLKQLNSLRELTGLFCGSGTITDDEMANLKDLTKLTKLTISEGEGITDAGLAHLKRMIRLTELRLPRIQVTDAGLAYLKGMTKLSTLELDGKRINGSGLAHLAGMNKLAHLRLFDSSINDAGLARLKGLTNLVELYLVGAPRVTQAGIDELKRSLPSLHINKVNSIINGY